MLQLKQELIKLAMQFIMANRQILYKLQRYMICQFDSYKDGRIEMN